MAPAAPSLHRRAALTGLEIFNFNLTKAYANRCDIYIYSKNKPNHFHIKLFMASEPKTGYICGFSVYTGRASWQIYQHLILSAQ